MRMSPLASAPMSNICRKLVATGRMLHCQFGKFRMRTALVCIKRDPVPNQPSLNDSMNVLQYLKDSAWTNQFQRGQIPMWESRCVSGAYEPAACEFTPLLTIILTSTLRFCDRPFALSFEAIGLEMPIAPGDTMCRGGTLPSCMR